MKLLLQIEPAQFDFFTKIFSKVSKNSSFEPICIKDSKLSKKMNTASIYCDFTHLFNDQKVNLNILDHQKASKIFRSVKTDQPISIFEDDEYYHIVYKFTDSRQKEYLFTLPVMKTSECEENENFEDEISNYKEVDNKTIEKESVAMLNRVAKAIGDNKVVFYLDDNDVILAIGIDDGCYMSLTDDKFDPKNSVKQLQSNTFFIFDAEEVKIKLYKDDENKYKVVYEMNFGFPIDFKVVEQLTDLDEDLQL